jgi:hypothetical protein
MLRLSGLVWLVLMRVSSLLYFVNSYSPLQKIKFPCRRRFSSKECGILQYLCIIMTIEFIRFWPRPPLSTRSGQLKVVDEVMLGLLQECKLMLFLLGRSEVAGFLLSEMINPQWDSTWNRNLNCWNGSP